GASGYQKLARIVRPGDRVTGDLRGSVEGGGWEVAHMAVDDASRENTTGSLFHHCSERPRGRETFVTRGDRWKAVRDYTELAQKTGPEPGAGGCRDEAGRPG